MMNTYELYAIRYATNGRRQRHENFMYPVPDPHDGPMPMDFFIWAAVGEGRTVLIDSGADANTCKTRGHDFLRCPTEGLAQLRIDPAEIHDVITTHLHWDHAGNFDKFPKARFHLQTRETQYAIGPCMCSPFLKRPFDVEQVCSFVRALYGGRVAFHNGEEEIAPGITVHHVGGHTQGLQIVRVMTRRGWVVVASDAMHYYANDETGTPFPVVVNVAEYMDGLSLMHRLAESADHVIAGHDPAVLSMYPAVSAQSEGLAVRLDVMPENKTDAARRSR
jgi:glyoxylase-like metal-dependent hydrolase (beta-lactamase superfamily II)